MDDLKYIKIKICNIPIYARVCDTPELREKGLMNVERLEADEGCLFVLDRPQEASFWMKNCLINLQTAMILENKKICDIKDMYFSDPYCAHRSSQPVKYILEMPEKFFTNNNIAIGEELFFDY